MPRLPRPRVLLPVCLAVAGLAASLPAAALAADPSNTIAPAINPAGNVTPGTVLTLTAGTWDATVTSPPTDVWNDCTSSTTCSPITPTGNTYTVVAGDVGNTISVAETATDATSASTATVTSNTVTVVPAPPTNTALPTLSGTAALGQVITASPGTWTNSPSFSYVWEDCVGTSCTPSPTSTNATTYTVTAADAAAGYGIRVEVTGKNAGGSAVADSATTGAVTGLPANTALPTITGTAAGGTLTEINGTWTNDPITSYAYQWLSCTSSAASTCTAISGATAQTYAVPAASDGLAYEVQETASNVSGAGTAATSAVLVPPLPANTALPAITGTVAVGQILTASTGTWSNGPTTYAYQWQRCTGTAAPLTCSAISAATTSTYTLTAADAGTTTEVQVTATNAGGAGAAATSGGSALIAPPGLRAPPGITGTAEEGKTLTESPAAVWSNSPTSITWQWYRCDSSNNNCVAITGAIANTYALTTADIGGTIQVWETASNAGGSSTTFSPFTAAVMNAVGVTPVPTSSSPPGISGTAQQGSTLAESHGAWTGNPGTFSYQWLRCHGGSCNAVPGATGQTYTLGPDDVGSSLEVQESASNTGGAGTAATSAPSGVVIANSTTALVAPASAVTNQTLTLVATVTASSGNAAASGTVSFRTASGTIAGCGGVLTNGSGQSSTVTCQTTFARGLVQATAVFAARGGSLVTGSSSQTSTISVGTAPTVTHLTVPAQATAKSNLKYTASVAPRSGPASPFAPSGTLTFMDRGKAIHGCSGKRLVKGGATCQVRYTSSGAHRISARYSGDANFAASTSTVAGMAVGRQMPNFITAVMQWYVHYSPTKTSFTSWLAYGVAPGSSLYLTCAGTGCPFATHTVAVANSARCTAKGKTNPCFGSRTVNLEPMFRGAHLAVGATVTVSILRCGWYGKHYTIKIRPRRGPSSAISDLPLGATRPGLRC